MTAARPVLKWAGGKSRLVGPILEALPREIETYHEPFVGGAAVFFRLARAGRFKRAVLSDRNADLVEVYRTIEKDVERLILVLQDYRDKNRADDYYRIREVDPKTLDPFERTARLIYLNKTGYNGLYRVNRSGRFNVPFGRYKNPRICDEENLRAAARALRGVVFRVADFEAACQEAEPGDAVYFDPPYVPVSRTSSFTAYHSDAFGEKEHERLAKVFADLAGQKVAAVLSNSDTPFTQRLYARFKPERVAVTRPINSKVSGRGPVQEILVVHRPRARRRASSS